MNKHKPILISGAAGFVGSHLVRSLVDDGYIVHALIKNSTNLDKIKSLAGKIILEKVSLLEEAELRRVVEKLNPQGVFHLAASNIQSGVTAPDKEVIANNIIGSRNLIAACNNIDYRFFVMTGSFLEYGPKTHPAKETDICEPTELYSTTKLAVSLYGQATAKQKNKPIVSFRLFTPYGPGIQKGRLVEAVVNGALSNNEIKLSKPGVTRDFVYVQDLVKLLKEGASQAEGVKGEIFNAGSGQATSLKELAELVLKLTSSRSKINWGSFNTQAYDTLLWQADMSKTFSKFAWRPKFSLEEGLEKTINFFKLC